MSSKFNSMWCLKFRVPVVYTQLANIHVAFLGQTINGGKTTVKEGKNPPSLSLTQKNPDSSVHQVETLTCTFFACMIQTAELVERLSRMWSVVGSPGAAHFL